MLCGALPENEVRIKLKHVHENFWALYVSSFYSSQNCSTLCRYWLVYIIIIPKVLVMWLSALDLPSEKDLHKILQVLEPHVSFLEDLTKMGGAMRSVLTQVLTSQQFYKDLSSGTFMLFSVFICPSFEDLKCLLKFYRFIFCKFLSNFSKPKEMYVLKNTVVRWGVGRRPIQHTSFSFHVPDNWRCIIWRVL